MLNLYKKTEDETYFRQVLAFVSCFFSKGISRKMEQQDRPFSLYGGLSGMASLLIDILEDPKKAMMPGFEDI